MARTAPELPLPGAIAAGTAKRWAKAFRGSWVAEALAMRKRFLCRGMRDVDVNHVWSLSLWVLAFVRLNARTRGAVAARVAAWRAAHPTVCR